MILPAVLILLVNLFVISVAPWWTLVPLAIAALYFRAFKLWCRILLAAVVLSRIYATSDEMFSIASDVINAASYIKGRVIHNIWVEQVQLTFQTVVNVEESHNMPLALTSVSVQTRDLMARATSGDAVLYVMDSCVTKRTLAMHRFYTELAAISLHIRRYYRAKRLDRITAEFEKLRHLAAAVEESCSDSRALAPATQLSVVHAQYLGLITRHTAAFTELGAIVNKTGILGLALDFAYESQYMDAFEKMCLAMHEYALQRASYYAT